jgi:Rhodopirellula transposase DDE domain
LLTLVEDATGGDPQSGAKFVRRSLEALSRELHQLDHQACPATVAKLLREEDFALRVNVKRFTGPAHPDRDRQFRYLQEQLDLFRDHGWPVVSVDTKKSELIGNFKNAGSLWCWHPEEVNCHDFLTDALGRATPYGVYDVLANRGFVQVGLSANTPAFAAAAVRAWWQRLGCKRYGGADRLLILADAGGSNGYRPRLWKKDLQEGLADRYGLRVTVCHYPTGASKWNPIEHRLFGPISINWAGEPLRSLERLLAFVRGTTTRGGLLVTAGVDERPYATRVRVSDAEMAELKVRHHDTCPRWNYTISPRLGYQWN